MPTFSRYVSTLLLLFASLGVVPAEAQRLLPTPDSDELVKLNVSIEFPRGGMTGICAMRYEGGVMKGCLFNEFGISALDFTYRPEKRKVRIEHAIKMLNKWYIKRVLRQDLLHVIDALAQGDTTYVNAKRHITYQFSTMIPDETQE